MAYAQSCAMHLYLPCTLVCRSRKHISGLVQRPRHLSSLREVELGAIVAALQQPPGHEASGQLECLAALEEMATITKMPGNGRLTQAEKLRRFSFQASPSEALSSWQLGNPDMLSHGMLQVIKQIHVLAGDHLGDLIHAMTVVAGQCESACRQQFEHAWNASFSIGNEHEAKRFIFPWEIACFADAPLDEQDQDCACYTEASDALNPMLGQVPSISARQPLCARTCCTDRLRVSVELWHVLKDYSIDAAVKLCTTECPVQVQRMFVQPGWNAIIPCSATITQVYLALATGKMDLDIQLSEVVHGRQKSLRDLATIPESQHVPLFAEMSRRIVNAMHFKRAEDDAAHRTSLKYTGKASSPLLLRLTAAFSALQLLISFWRALSR